MITFKAEFKKDDERRYKNALNKLERRVNYWLLFRGGEFNRRCAQWYANRVIDNIHQQRFSARWPGYSFLYGMWKRTYFPGTAAYKWMLKGDLLDNIMYIREGGGWFGGIPAGIYDTGGKSWFGRGDVGRPKEIAMYARVLEYGGDYSALGGGFHYPRPLFRPTFEQFLKTDVPRFVDTMMKDIERQWT